MPVDGGEYATVTRPLYQGMTAHNIEGASLSGTNDPEESL